MRTTLPLCVVLLLAPALHAQTLTGDLQLFHAVTLTFDGPAADEAGPANPFRDCRLNVTFTHGDAQRTVPGYFAADGKAAESGASAGNKWRVRFTPDLEGPWTWRVSFRTGPDVAVADEPDAGKPEKPDGLSGEFTVGPSNKKSPDLRAKGILRYVGKPYLQFSGSGDSFIKGGADSPENFLGYEGFDGTRSERQPKNRKGEADAPPALHAYKRHIADWNPGDPTWGKGRGRGIIGALNYLASKGVNSVYFLTMNVIGDGQDVWPWIDSKTRDRFDCSKLDQWDIVFSHMTKLGIMLHVVTQEQENDQLLDGGELGLERKLYYRELVARFGHHPAVTWNLGEENTNTTEQRKAFAAYFHKLDPYNHPVVIHTFPPKKHEVYEPLLGFESLDGASLQIGNVNTTHADTLEWRGKSIAAGHPWIVSLDEQGPAKVGVKPDLDDADHDDMRHLGLWGNLMAGGAGVEWYFGYSFPNNDLNCEDFRSRERMWDQTHFALEFFRRHLPFADMEPADNLVTTKGAWCLAKPGAVYAVYLPPGLTTQLKLGDGAYTVRWYNPRAGGELQTGPVTTLSGGGPRDLGKPPADADKDWVVLVKHK